MTSTLNPSEQVSIIKMRAELTGEQCDNFRHQLIKHMDEQVRDFVLDASDLEVIDSQGLETLLWLQDTCAERLGQVRLAGCCENLVKILEMTRLAAQLERHDTVEQAVASLH